MRLKKLFFLLLFALLAIPVTWANNVYVKVTSESQLQVGKKYILAEDYIDGAKTYVQIMGKFKTTNFPTTTISYDTSNPDKNTKSSNDNTAIDIVQLTTAPTELTLAGSTDNWTFSFNNNGNTMFLATREGATTGGFRLLPDGDEAFEYAMWSIVATDNGFIVKNNKKDNFIIGHTNHTYAISCSKNVTYPVYLYVQAGESTLETSTNNLDIEETGTFTINGNNLLKDVKITLKKGSNAEFSFNPETITLTNHGVNGENGEVTVSYPGTENVATATLVINSGLLNKEVTVTATKPVPSLVVSSNTLDLGSEPRASFTVNGAHLSEDVSIAIKDGSDEGFTVSPTTMSLDNGSVNNAEVLVLYNGSAKNATATITITSGDLSQEVTVTASAPDLFTTPGNYFVQNKGNNKYVVINGTIDAAASAASQGEADIITLGFTDAGIVSTMKNYEGDGDLIATLETVKEVLTSKLQQNNMNADFVDDMFKIKLIKTGDSDGSMYFCFDVPAIEDVDNIRSYLLGQGINNQLVKDYLDLLLQPGKRIYLCTADNSGTFSFTQDKSVNATKWLVEEYLIIEDDLFTTAGNYYVRNKGNNKYVVINGATDAAASVTDKEDADVITLGFNEDGTVSTMKNYAGDGDLIATLETVKSVLKNKLESQNLNADFVDDMFRIKLVKTDDNDGSMYFCFDIPKISNIDEIRNYLLNAGINNQLVKDYLDVLLQPRKRIYLNVADENGTFSFTDNKALATSKWLVEAMVEDELFTTPGNYYINNKKSGKYVKLENSQLADVTAENQAHADVITLDFNENGAVSVMKQYNGDGDMIATLDYIKESFETHLTAGGYPTDFLDQMFTMKMVMTGDNDGSVYITVDVPRINNFDAIRSYLIEKMSGNAAVAFYLGHMTPGKRHYLSVDSDDSFGFTLDNGNASKWLVEEAKITEDGDILFTTPGYYYINNKSTGKYVQLVNSTLADVTAENKDDADIIILDFSDEGNVSVMSQYDGDGDMIATLNYIKESFETHLTAGGYPTDFLEQMFTMKMVMTGDNDGSVFLTVDVPEIENFDAIRNYLIQKMSGNVAVAFYLSHMVPGNRHYLCVDTDDITFGFTLDNGIASKWLVEDAQFKPTDDDLFTEHWHYYINNKLTGKYVRLVNSTLADVTAETENDADIITLDFDEDGNVSVMKQYRGDGDMIATLNYIKDSFETHLTAGGYPTDFLDQMFTMRIVKTGDDDGSVYLCVDVPLISDFNNIRSYLIQKMSGNAAVSFYLSHMVPGKRHYLCVDNDDTFGFTLDDGTASKWMVHRLEVIPIDEEHFPDQYFREFVHAKYDKNDNWWLSQAELDAVTSIDINAANDASYANITDLTGIEWFTNLVKLYVRGTSTNKSVMESLDVSNLVNLEELYCYYGNLEEVNVSECTNLKIIQLHNQDALTSLDLTNNTNVVEISLEDNSNFSTLDIPTPLETLESLSIRRCDAFKNQTIDLTGDNNLYVLSLAGNVRYNLIKGVSKEMTNLRYLSVDYNTFEDDVLDLTGCQYLFELSLVNCSLRELLLNGCTNLGTRQSSRPGKPAQDGAFTIHSNYLRALDLTGVTGELDATAPRDYNYNITNYYPELFADYIKHSGYNGQITTEMKADVSLVYIDRDVTPNVYTYLLYLRMDDNKSSEKEGTFEEGLAEVGETNFKMNRVNRWVRLEGEKDLQLVSGNRLLTGKAAPTELDPDLIVGDILSLGMYTIADGEGEKEVTGKIAYLYNTKQDEQGATVVNPDEQLDTQTKVRDFYKSQTISSDGTSVIEEGDNLFPFEVSWKATISDDPIQVVTGVESVRSNSEVMGVTYYNVTGLSSERPFEGVNIVVTRYSDGTTSTAKRLF